VLDEAERRELQSVVLREGLDQRLVHVLLGVLGRVLQRYLKLNEYFDLNHLIQGFYYIIRATVLDNFLYPILR
jgi:hypothetical protein